MLRRWLMALVVFLGVGLAVLLSEQPTGSLVGKVELPPGSTPAAVQVIASGPVSRSVSLTEEGQYRFDRLPLGQYQVTVQGGGLETLRSEGVATVREGVIAPLPTLRPRLLPPSLTLYSTSQVFTSGEKAQLQMRATNLDSVQIQLYRFSLREIQGSPLLWDLANSGYGSLNSALQPLLRQEHLRTWQQPLRQEPQGWVAQTLDLGMLPPGAYWVEAEGLESPDTSSPLLRSDHWFLVSDLGLIQKQTSTELVVQAVHLRELRPLAGIQVRVIPWEGDPLTGTTDADGLARFTLPSEDNPSVMIYAQGSDPSLQSLSTSYAYGWNQGERIYAYTDRPLYRPGQTVYFRALIRDQTTLTPPPAGTQVTLSIVAPNGDPLAQQTLTTTAFGSVHGSFQLPEEASLGSYGLDWQVLGPQSTSREHTSFQVEAYRKPEFEVTVTPGRAWLLRGGSLTVQTEAQYLFGGPVADAQLHYRVFSHPDWSLRYSLLPRSEAENFFAEDLEADTGYYGGYGRLVAEGKGFTDAHGRAEFRLNRLLQDLDWEEDSYWGGQEVQQLRIEVEVTDLSRRVVTGTARAWVTAAPFALFAEADRHLPAPGEAVTYRLQARDYDGRPVNVSGEMRLERWRWDPRSSSYQRQATLRQQTFPVDNGTGIVTLNLPVDLEPGDYRVQLTARDAQGRRAQDISYLWVVEPGSPLHSWGATPSLEIIPDRQIYEVGEQAQLLIVSPVPDVTVLVGIEGSRLHQVQVLPLQGHTATLTLPITAEYRPNIYATATVIGPERRLYQNETLLRVSPVDRFLQVEIETDKPSYQPGETAQIQIRTRDAQGRPVSAEVGLGIVDSAIYLLRPDPTPDIRRFFYRRLYNQVTTSTSFPRQYPGGADKLANQIRQDFQDTAAWFPDLVTDANGLAQVQVRWPDNLTTWRLTARAATADTQVGSALSNLLVSKDLLLRLAAPRFWQVGDTLTLAAIVQNRTDQPQQVEVRLEVPGNLQLQGNPRQRISVAAQGAERVEWPLQVLGAGETTVRAWAEGSRLQDALQLTLPSRPFGAVQRFSESGQLPGSTPLTLPLPWPQTWVAGSRHARLELTASPLAALLGPLDYLVEFPYGCTEQTLSRFLPALALELAGQRLGLSLGSATLERLPRVLQAGLQRLEGSQNFDGGWGWWAYDSSNPYLTGYILQGLSLAQAAGYSPKGWQVERALNYLREQLGQPQTLSPDLRAYVIYSLALWDPSGSSSAMPALEQLSTWGLAYQGLAALQRGEANLAQIALDQALERHQLDPQGRWFIPLSLAAAFNERSTYDEMEVVGPLLQLATRLQDARAAEIATAILQQRQNNRWSTTKATADALLGLTAYYQAQLQQTPGPGEVLVFNGTSGSLVGRWQATADNPRRVIELADRDVDGLSSLRLETSGPGPLYYSLTGEAFTPTPEQPQSQGFTVARSYFRLQPQRQANGQILYREQLLQAGDSVPAGEMLLARLTVVAAQDSHYVLIEDPLPSGAEITSQDPRLLTGSEPDYWWDWFWTHQENREDRVAFFSTFLEKGSHEFVYLFRPEIPGQLQISPAFAEEMYTPGRYGRSSSHVLRVVP